MKKNKNKKRSINIPALHKIHMNHTHSCLREKYTVCENKELEPFLQYANKITSKINKEEFPNIVK